MKKKLIVLPAFFSYPCLVLPQLPVMVERAFGGAKYVYRGIKGEDGNSQSGVRLSCGIDYTRFRPYGYGWELRRLAG